MHRGTPETRKRSTSTRRHILRAANLLLVSDWKLRCPSQEFFDCLSRREGEGKAPDLASARLRFRQHHIFSEVQPRHGVRARGENETPTQYRPTIFARWPFSLAFRNHRFAIWRNRLSMGSSLPCEKQGTDKWGRFLNQPLILPTDLKKTSSPALTSCVHFAASRC